MNGKYRNILFLFIAIILVTVSCSIFKQDPNACSVCYGRGLTHVDCVSCASTGRCHKCKNGYVSCPICRTNPGKVYDRAKGKFTTCKLCDGKGAYWKQCDFCFGGICRRCGGRMHKCQYCKGTGKKMYVGN